MPEPLPKIRPGQPDDIADCVVARGLTRENDLSVEELAARGITEESWRADVATGRLPGYVAVAGDRIVGYCFGYRDSSEIAVLVVLPA